MANATLTLKISGSINGKAVSASFSQTVEDINKSASRLGTCQANATIVTHMVPGGASTPVVDTDADIMLVGNIGTGGGLKVTFYTAANDVNVYLSAGEFIIMQTAAAGGVINSSTTATTSTVIALENIELKRPSPHDPSAKFWVMGCYKYAS